MRFLFALRFLFKQSRVAKHLFAGGNAEFFQNIVVVEFERAFADTKNVGDFFCAFAVQIEIENRLFRFRKFFQTDFECFVVVGVYLVFPGISQPFDLGLPLSDFGGLVFGYDSKFFVTAFQIFRFEVAKFILFGKIDE